MPNKVGCRLITSTDTSQVNKQPGLMTQAREAMVFMFSSPQESNRKHWLLWLQEGKGG